MSARPWSKLWHAEWAADLRLRGCTLAQRGAFWSFYLLMHQGDGRLPVSVEDAASALGISATDADSTVRALVRAGLFEFEGDTLTCPDLVRQLTISKLRADVGRLGKKPPEGGKKGTFARAKKPSKVRGSGSGSSSEGLNSEEGERERERGTDLTRWWSAEFERTRGAKFDWVRNGKQGGCPDAIALSMLGQQFDHAEIRRRITRYLESDHAFDARTATPRMFRSRYATLAVEVRPHPERTNGSATLAYLEALSAVPERKATTP